METPSLPPRRHFLQQLAALAPLSLLGSLRAETTSTEKSDKEKAHDAFNAIEDFIMSGTEQIAMLMYPGFTALDFVAPHYFFACLMGAKVHLVTNQPTLAPLASDLGLAIVPTCTLADCPANIDVLFIPGGTSGTLNAARDPATLAFVKDRAARARYITSVCTGAFVLGAAGLLRNRRATSHWIVQENLADFGATAVDERVVADGNLITGAGVTAGIDLALAVVEKLRGRGYAQALMLQAEYNPAPPFPIVTPKTASPVIVAPLYQMCAPIRAEARELGKATNPPAAQP